MTPNPYDPPGAKPEPEARTRFFTAIAVGAHAFLLPPFGAVMALINYRRAGDGRGALRASWLYGLPAFGLLGFSLAMRSPRQAILIWVARVVLASALLRDQQRLVAPRFAEGARPARWVLGWLVVLVLLVAVLAVWQLLQPAERAAAG